MQKWLILDRDGVINYDSDAFIKSPDEWRALPGSLEAIAKLNKAGYKIIIVSNQSGIARGLFDLPTLELMHAKLKRLLAALGGEIENIYFCPHGPNDHCDCRKPNPGLLKQFAQDYQLELTGIYAVGDSIRDLQAAQSAGAIPILVRTGKGENSEKSIVETRHYLALKTVPVYQDLAAFADQLLAH